MSERKLSPQDVEQIRQLRKSGMSFPAIGRKFNVDHTSIIYWCKKMGLPKQYSKRKGVYPNYYRLKHPIVQRIKITHTYHNPILNKNGSTYKEYLDKENNRIAKTKIIKDSMGVEHRF